MNPPLKKIFTLKKVARKPKKKKIKKEETPPNSQEFSPFKSSPPSVLFFPSFSNLSTFIQNFRCPEPKRKPVKILRSLTLDNHQKPPPKPLEPEAPYPKEKENEYLNIYQSQLNSYILYGYTHTMDNYVKRIIQNSDYQTKELQSKYDLLFVIKGMIKNFMINELELIFLSYFLEQNKWDYLSCLSIARCIEAFPEIIKFNYEIDNPSEYKALLIYLCYSCFAIKNCFRDPNEMMIYRAFMKSTFQEFGQNYVDWRQSNQEFLQFDPLKLNQIFEKNSYSWTGMQKSMEYSHNLDLMVNTILEMSPPYLYEKSLEKNQSQSKLTPEFESPIPFELKTGILYKIKSNNFFFSKTKRN